MRRTKGVLSILLLMVTGTVFAAGPHRLADKQLDTITAGTNVSNLTLQNQTQQNVNTLNLVNASDSDIANGINVWNGGTSNANGPNTVSQTNTITQHSNAAGSAAGTINLQDNAEQSASAVNVVNAIGSVVGNGVNVSATPDLGPNFSLIQSNVITHLGAITAGTNVSTLTLQNQTQQNVSTLNLISAIGSDVANGINVWNGGTDFDNGPNTVTQSNTITQSSLGSSYAAGTINLLGTAQQSASALNIVNAIGSVVGNGVNVSSTPSLGPNFNLVQSNIITH